MGDEQGHVRQGHSRSTRQHRRRRQAVDPPGAPRSDHLRTPIGAILRVPTIEEALRIKAFLVIKRTRPGTTSIYVDASAADPVASWPQEALAAALERGGIELWRRTPR